MSYFNHFYQRKGAKLFFSSNYVLKYAKCVMSQKGWYLLISDAFGAVWMHYNYIMKTPNVENLGFVNFLASQDALEVMEVTH